MSADLPLVTLDHNALIALRDGEADAPAVHALLELKRAEHVRVCVPMTMDTEAQSGRGRLDWPALTAWRQLYGLEVLGPRSVAFAVPEAPGVMTYSVELDLALTARIHHILFPGIPFAWYDYLTREASALAPTECQALQENESLRYGGTWIPPRPTPALDALDADQRSAIEQLATRLHRKWFNAKNDALGFHMHLTEAWHSHHPEWAVFVTNDRNFHKLTKREALRAAGYRGNILRPAEALQFLRAVLELPCTAQAE